MAPTRTAFTAERHGFRFPNFFEISLDFDLPFFGSVDLGSIVYGLCGGMCFAALDYFQTGRVIPPQTAIADITPRLRSYLTERQIDSLALPVIPRVIEWMLRDDGSVGRLTAQREFPKLYRRVNRGEPAVLALIRGRGAEDPTQNHQVVAVGYDLDEGTRDLTVYLYDPNHPHPQAEPTLHVNLSRPSRGIEPSQSTGEELRGFFVINYRPQTPP